MSRFSTAAFSRRRFLAASAGATATLLAAAACGDSDDDTADSASSSSGSSASSGFPVTIEHKFGSTTVEKAPERVVSLGWADADVLLALGVVPVGFLDWFKVWDAGVGPWAQDKLGSSKPTVMTGEVNFEKVASLRPDLITFVQSDGAKATWEKLKQLAPSIYGPAAAPAWGVTWKDQTEYIAKSVGKLADGQKLIDATGAAFAKAKAANPEFAGKTVAVAAAYDGKYGAYVGQDARVQFMQALGFTNSPKLEALKKESFYIDLSKERVGLLDADVTIVFGLASTTPLAQDTVLQSIPSAKAGRLVIIDDADLANAFSTNSVLSIPWTIEKFVPQIKKALA
ncbi:ABC transporter substrate-binding protein [Cryptosporangium minutisporangium]|uniref:Iron-siderophore ABC transporter substrate-binding protein n=1 Tax=Cryptosporangium minutisporangium TaxID=113569 RepID=A0ABP6T873_9ACTN